MISSAGSGCWQNAEIVRLLRQQNRKKNPYVKKKTIQNNHTATPTFLAIKKETHARLSTKNDRKSNLKPVIKAKTIASLVEFVYMTEKRIYLLSTF